MQLFSNIKHLFLIIVLLCIYFIICAFSYVKAVSSNIEDSVFRLHVIANSDSIEDQNLKYLVRDSVLEFINNLSKQSHSKNDIMKLISSNIEDIEKIATQTIQNNGYNYSVKLNIGNFSFPTKTYGDISLPAGFYDALKIEIGEAKGKNWWCVMFPPLCFVDVTSGIVPDSSKEIMQDNLSDEEYQLISESTSNIKFKFKIIELFQNLNINLAQS